MHLHLFYCLNVCMSAATTTIRLNSVEIAEKIHLLDSSACLSIMYLMTFVLKTSAYE